MSCGVELCPTGTVGNVTMRGGSRGCGCAMQRGGSLEVPIGTNRVARIKHRGGSCPAGQLRMLGTYPEVIRSTPGPMDGWGVIKGGYINSQGAGGSGRSLRGGGCGCANKGLGFIKGGFSRKTGKAHFTPYTATKKNLKYLRRYKQGKSIGFTMTASLKAKGLIKRANGTYKVSKKYQ